MKRKEFITFYEEELEKLRKHKEGLLEIDKSTVYTDKKINHIEDLLTILENCNKSEILKEENIEYRKMKWKIKSYLQSIEKLEKLENSNEEVKQKVSELLNFLKEAVGEEENK